jgi:anti-sigma factor RsiW
MARPLLDGYADGELDLVNHLKFEQHLEECKYCRSQVTQLLGMRSALADESMHFRAPDGLRKRIRQSLGEDTTERKLPWWRLWTPVIAAAALIAAVALTTIVYFRSAPSSEELLSKELVNSHVRSMMVDHATDVLSSDQHTVKPWYEGKLDFSPQVTDLASRGFPLIGGRLDYAAGRPIAALVYKRREHLINLFVFPVQNASENENKMLTRQGFNIVHWNASGMTFWAISDLNLSEMQEFAQAVQE